MSKTEPEPEKRRMELIPMITMVEVPVLSEAERAKMLASLEEAEAQIKAGHFTEHDSASFLAHLRNVREGAKLAAAK